MLRVLLVDDEPFVVQGLRILIDWEAEGFEIAGTASTGEEAISVLKKKAVDLILADIKMPVMDGLKLLHTIKKENYSKAYFVILSGYSDFVFAQQAMRDGCTDYILKPVQQTELIALLKKVKKMHESSREKGEEVKEGISAYLARNVIALLSGKYDQINLEVVKNHLPRTSDISYIDIEIDETNLTKPIPEDKKRFLQRQLYENCREYLGEVYRNNCIFDVSRQEDCYDIGLLFCESMAHAKGLGVREYLDDFLKSIETMTGVELVMFVGCQVSGYHELSKSYRTSAIAKSFCTLRMDKNITYYEEKMKKKYSRQVLLKQTLDELIQAIEQNNQKLMNGKTEEFFHGMEMLNMNAQLVELNMNYLLFQLIQLAVEQDEKVNQSDVLELISTRAFKKKFMWGSENQLKEFVHRYAKYLVKLRQKAARGPLAEIDREIQKRYMDNLTLKELSAKYFVNSAYLGQIFKKKYGMSFKDYLNQYRLEQASLLLLRTDKKVYEIAESVGYRNLDYFIDRFIRLKGCTPAKFRKHSKEIKNL